MKQFLLYLVISSTVAFNTASVCADAVSDVFSQVTWQVESTFRSLR